METVILASSSPRRKELLNQVGIEFLIIKPDVDEKRKHNESIKNFIKRVSREKADSVLKKIKTRNTVFIVSADTVVVAPDGKELFGKPHSKDHASKMLRKLSGRKHVVLTAYTVLLCKMGEVLDKKTRIVSTMVWFREISSLEIDEYVMTKEPMDKAGAYAAQGRGMIFIQKISGSYTNVVGLPIEKLILDIRRLSYDKRRKKIRS